MNKIDKAKFRAYIQEELENVSKLAKQPSDKQIERLEKYSKEEIHQTLLEMENHAPLTKKYRSVYLTLQNWIELKRQKTQVAQQNQVKRMGFTGKMTYHEALAYLEKKGNSPSELEDKFDREKNDNGKYYFTLKS